MKIEKMKNENKMRGRGVQFGLKGGNQNHPKSKNQKKITLRGRGIEIKKLNREKKEKRKKEKRSEIREREREEKRERRETPTRPPTEKPNATTTHPVAPANYIMIFNGPKGKTWPPKIFGRGVGWDGLEFGLRCQSATSDKSQVSSSIKKYKKKSHESRGSGS